MAFLFGDSFDFYAVASPSSQITTNGVWNGTSATAPSISSATRFSAGRSMQTALAGWVYKNDFGNTSNTVFFAGAVYAPSFAGSTTNYNHVIYFSQGGTGAGNNHVAVGVRNDGAIVVSRGAGVGSGAGTILATFPSAITAATWTHLQIKVVIDNTAGAVYIRKDGDTSDTYSVTGVDTQTTANAYCDTIALGGIVTGQLFDDVMIFDDSGSAPNNWVGDVRAVSLTPIADTAQKDFAPSTGTANYANVDDTSPDGDTTYNYAAAVNAADLYEMSDLLTTPTAVHVVVVRSAVRKTDASTRNAQTLLKSGSTTAAGASMALSTSYGVITTAHPTDPATSSAWTASAVNAVQVGVKISG